ncbi:MAG: hypothetical protein CL878_05425 [Dehalococcoidia bacterium]|nr:hypothetical protein [Dehalococcoidia bacterium]
MTDDERDPKDPDDEEERWEIDPEKSTAEEIVLRPARHPRRGHTRTLGDIAEKLGERKPSDDKSDGQSSDDDSGKD